LNFHAKIEVGPLLANTSGCLSRRLTERREKA
jgi:rRNA-processing protein FCF1